MVQEYCNYLFNLLMIISEGLSQLVETQQVVIVTLGGDAQFSCRLMEPRDVLQVTWQKETPGGNENVASYNKRFGPKVNPPFNMKVLFLNVGLQNCSVIIRGVSREDESCYKCLFNIYPDGAISGRTCLQVNVVDLFLPVQLVLENSTTDNVAHPNGTVTVTIISIVAVPSLPYNDTMVRCLASSSYVIREGSIKIPTSLTGSTPPPVSNDGWIRSHGTVGGVMCLVVLIALICNIIWWLRKRSNAGTRCPTPCPRFPPELRIF
ncbi:OX-2 membrane glycoprotein-like isoform X2 [Esox lucius]|uniref:OX-2 membrane glycoprotein-like isoform X2 n=1 Tax=Esox lucius TaxID=8010 RepID=UPI0014774107|nr:OX-2 membrane glycoprotein-like isoform X2 [Esox lucius]